MSEEVKMDSSNEKPGLDDNAAESLANLASGIDNIALDDDMIQDLISTEAKPRKKPNRRKRKWRRQTDHAKIQDSYNLEREEDNAFTRSIYKTNPETDSHIERPVPSLYQMCLSLVKKHWSHVKHMLPSKVRHQLSDDILQNKLLPCVQCYLQTQERTLQYFIAMKSSGARIYGNDGEIRVRSLYTHYHDYQKTQSDIQMDNLPVTDLSSTYLPLADYLNCLIPTAPTGTATEIKPGKHGNLECKRIDNVLSAVKQRLQKDLPCLTEHFFDNLLPYVWWARGNMTLAEKYFEHAISKSPSDTFTAMMYNELGRMYVYFEGRQLASKYFLEAGVHTKYYAPSDIQTQIDHRQNILIASAFDNGFLDSATSYEACTCWNNVFGNIPCHRDIYQCTVSLMCYHFSHSPAVDINRSLALDAVLTKRASFYALSLLKAIDGYDNASQGHYAQFATLNSITKPFPWTPIILAATVHKKEIHPIPMIWRKVLTHPMFEDRGKPSLFDVSHSESSLWISEDGFLTGDFQLTLPPMPKIQFNLYTGDIVHSQSLPVPGPWKSRAAPDHQPSQIRVYEDDTGTTVDLFTTYYLYYEQRNGAREISELILKWQRNDVEVRIDLKKEFRRLYRDTAKHPEFLDKHFTDQETIETFLKYVDQSYENGSSMLPSAMASDILRAQSLKNRIVIKEQQLKNAMKLEYKKQLKKEIKQMRKDEAKRKKPYFLVWLESFHSIGNALILAFRSSENALMFFVFNCKNQKGIRDFKTNILSPSERDKCDWGPTNVPFDNPPQTLISAPVGQGLHYPEASVFVVPRWLIESKKQADKSMFTIFNENGEVLTEVMETATYNRQNSEAFFRHATCVLGSTIFAIHRNKRRIISNDVVADIGCQSYILPEIEKMLMLGKFLLVKTVAGVYILDEHLEPLIWNATVESGHLLEVADEERRVQGQFSEVKILTCDCKMTGCTGFETKMRQVLLGLDDSVLIIQLYSDRTPMDALVCSCVVQVPGIPMEACYVGEDIGFLVASQVNNSSNELHHEELYQFNNEGRLLGILPYLGFGPHKFLPVYLNGSEEAARRKCDPTLAVPTWRIFCFDGYGAVCCIKPFVDM